MSGITGLLRTDGTSVDPATVERLTDVLAYRGPDGRATWTAGEIGLGHLRLHTTPESLYETLPDTTGDGTLAITADARLDNRDALRAALEPGSASGDVLTDSDLILAAYEEWGDECPTKLLGAFAFAIWDTRSRQLFCARDHMGVKPFCYHHHDGFFAFASQPKALLTLPQVPDAVDEVRIGDFLASLQEDTERTFYRAIRRLPPAHSMTVDERGVSSNRYWSLDPTRTVELDSDEAYAERFRELFTEAVSCRLRSAFPRGTLLSGGLDSSSIACTARELLDETEDLHTFSARFDDVPECDESEYIEAVLDGGPFESHSVRGDRLSPLADVDDVLRHQDGPYHAPNHHLHWGLYRAAREAGVRVLLDGVDGDTTVSHGSGYLAQLARSGHVLRLAREVSRLATNFDRPRLGLVKRGVIAPLVPPAIRVRLQQSRWDGGPVREANSTLDPAFADRTSLEDRLLESVRQEALASGRVRDQHYRKLASGLHAHILEVSDRSAAAHGIEPRYPFYDKRLVEFCLALPAAQKARGGWTRYVMRRAMEGILPEAIRWRGGKANLRPAFVAGLRRESDRLGELLLGDSTHLEAYLDPQEVERVYRDTMSGASADAVETLWKDAILSTWLRQRGEAVDSMKSLEPMEVNTL